MRAVPLKAPSRLLLVVVVGVLALAACARAPGSTTTWSGIVLDAPKPRPAFTLTDTAGAPYDFRTRTAGEVTLLFAGFTHCDDVCPTQLADIAAALRQLPAEQARHVTVVFVTTDPARDDPATVRRFLDQFDTTTPVRFVGLTGTSGQVAAAVAASGLPAPELPTDRAGNYQVDHDAAVLAYGRDDRAHLGYPAGTNPADLRHDLTQLLAGQAPPPPSAAELAERQAVTGANGEIGPVTVVGARFTTPTAGSTDLLVTLASTQLATVTSVRAPGATATSLVTSQGGEPLPPTPLAARGVVVWTGGTRPYLRFEGLTPAPGARTVPVTFTVAGAGSLTLDVPLPSS